MPPIFFAMKWIAALFFTSTILASEIIELYTGGFFKPEELKTALCERDLIVTELDVEVFRKRKLKIPIFSKNSVSKWIFMNVPPSAVRNYEFNRLPQRKVGPLYVGAPYPPWKDVFRKGAKLFFEDLHLSR